MGDLKGDEKNEKPNMDDDLVVCEAGRSVGICGRKKTLVIRDVKKNKKSENGPQQHSTCPRLFPNSLVLCEETRKS